MARAKQEELIDVGHPAAKQLREAAEAYVYHRNVRMELLKQESEDRDAILAIMHEHELKEFEGDGLTIKIVVRAEKISVTMTINEKQENSDDCG